MQRKILRFISEPNGDNLAFGNDSTQPKPRESNTATDDHEETEDGARDDGEHEKLSSRGRFIRCCQKGRICNNCPTCACMFLSRYDMHSVAYKNLYHVYKLALTSSVTKEQFAKIHFQNVNCSKHDYEARYRQII
jgi:hypothetical protein